MKVLILSCNTGEGHNSCAKALKVAMQRYGIECEIQDTLALVSDTLSQKVSNAYVFSTRGSLFKIVYRLGAWVSHRISVQSIVYGANRLYAEKLYNYIADYKFDTVVCVHLFPAEAITALRRNGTLKIPSYFIQTDYTCIPFLKETDLDYYVIPHRDLIDEFAKKGIKRSKLVPIGIPVDEQKFITRVSKTEAREQIICQCNADERTNTGGHWFLIMSGSMGFGNLEELLRQLMSEIAPNDRVLCVCGRNEQMRHSLQEEFALSKQVWIFGFTDQISIFMDASDVVFTKPGGITSTEVCIKNIPLIHTSPIPGLENYNANFFHSHSMSYHTCDVAEQVKIAVELCQNNAFRSSMLAHQRINTNPNTSNETIKLILQTANKSTTRL